MTAIAMWSGPRTISTAMMRSWEARGDTAVCDEPLYAHYLEATGAAHPGADEVISHHERSWRAVVTELTGPVPGGKAIYYQKHMAHHLLPEIDRDWLDDVTNAFLIRDPARIIPSLVEVTPEPRLADTGLPQLVEIFDLVRERTGRVPPVVDSADVLGDPAGVLSRLCAALGVNYTDRMLTWPGGPRPTDGIWARHWYASVHRSTGFAPTAERDRAIPPRLSPLVAECRPLYRKLHEHRI